MANGFSFGLNQIEQLRWGFREILAEVMMMDNANDIRAHVEAVLDQEGLGSFIRPLQASGAVAQREPLRSLSLQDVLPGDA